MISPRLLPLGLVIAALAVGCGEGIALDPASTARPPGAVRDGDGGDVSAGESDGSGSEASGEGGSDGFVVDGRMDTSADNDRSADRTSADANDVDAVLDTSGDASSEIRTDISDDVRDALIDVSSDGFDDTRRDTGDASRDLSVDASRDMAEGGPDAPDAFGDAWDASEDGARDGASYDAFDGCTVECWPAADYYVDASAPLGGSGTKQRPFKTITAAIQAHQATPGVAKKAYVAAGTYDAALGESFPLVLRGLSLQGAGRDLTFIVGAGALDHSAAGGALDQRYMVTAVAGDPTLSTQVEQLTVRPPGPVPIDNFIGVLCDRGDAIGQVASPGGQTRFDSVRVGPGYQVGAAAVASTLPFVTGCELVITKSILTGVWFGVFGQGCDWAGVEAPVSIEIGLDDPASGNTFSWIQGDRSPGAGVYVADCLIRASIQHNTFVDSLVGVTTGVGIDPALLPRSHVSVKSNTFERLGNCGFGGDRTVFLDELSDNRFVGITSGGSSPVPGGGIAAVVSLMSAGKIRRNQFIGNDTGVHVVVEGEQGTPVDFGTVTDPGNNDFRCNSSILDYGSDLQIYYPGGPDNAWEGILRAAGNAWDHVPPTIQTVSPAPNGSDIALHDSPGVTVDRRNSTLSTSVCPDGRVPGQ